MQKEGFFFAAVISALFFPFCAHLILTGICGLFRQAFSRQKGVVLSSLLGFLFFTALFAPQVLRLGMCGKTLWPAVYLLLTYVFSAYIYFHVFNMSETARRVRILTYALKGESRKEQVIRRYSAEEVLLNRLKRLVAMGELKMSGDKYLIKRRWLCLPEKIFFLWRNILFPYR
jgi:hypothetical protein